MIAENIFRRAHFKKFIKKAGRVITGVVTGGTSEVVRAGIKEGKKLITPDIPPPAAIPGVPTVKDPLVAAAKKKLRQSEKRRRGRRAAILTGPEDDKGLGSIRRASATGA